MNLPLSFRVRFHVLTMVTVKICLFWDMTPCPFDIGCRMPQILEGNISFLFLRRRRGSGSEGQEEEECWGHGVRAERQDNAGTEKCPFCEGHILRRLCIYLPNSGLNYRRQ